MATTKSLYPRYKFYKDGSVLDKQRGEWVKASSDSHGYLSLHLYNASGDRKAIRLHRLLALLYLPNPENKPCVDHIDGNCLNNHLSNLRWATISENSQNRTGYKGRTSQYTGVYRFNQVSSIWRARISVNGKRISIGTYSTELEAHHAYQEAKSRLHINS
jgi:hypothetical protein